MKSLPQFCSLSSSIDDISTLIPGLPNDVAALLLSFLPYSHHARLKSTCKSWRLFFSSNILISLRFTHPNSLWGIVVIEDHHNHGQPGIFMLDGDEFFRYEMTSNRWVEESRVPRKTPFNSSYGFVALNGELYVISFLKTESAEARRLRHHKKGGSLYMQIYDPVKKTWRSLITRSPFQHPMDFDTAAMCTIRI
ncbi:F-box/kelch-repeat protein OR23, partial [Cucurbita argyrosperma subsp. sororia]